MTDHRQQGWEPDPQKTGHWTSMFEAQPRAGAARAPQPPAFDDADLDRSTPADELIYQPWLLQRGRSRPTLLLHLRRFEPRSGMWQGWALSYPTLNAVEYVGPRMIALDFGARQFVIEGDGLSDLVDRLQQGTVTCIQEYDAAAWAAPPEGSVITKIERVRAGAGG